MRQKLSRRMVHDKLDLAMGIIWDDDEVRALFYRLQDRFPRHHKTLARIEDWAGDNSNVRCEDGYTSEFTHAWDKVMRAVDRLPWDRRGA